MLAPPPVMRNCLSITINLRTYTHTHTHALMDSQALCFKHTTLRNPWPSLCLRFFALLAQLSKSWVGAARGERTWGNDLTPPCHRVAFCCPRRPKTVGKRFVAGHAAAAQTLASGGNLDPSAPPEAASRSGELEIAFKKIKKRKATLFLALQNY